MKFSELGLMPLISTSLESMGYTEPTPIQTQAIPPALAGRDVLGCAQTGTGKTCAFAAPILQRLAQSPRRGDRVIRALILTPTRELALQIQENFEAYGKGLPLRSTVIFGGVGQKPQVERLKRGVEILVATPGRLLDLHNQKLLDLSCVEIFVLDEADRMLDMGFIHDVRRVLKVLPERKQTLFFSATMPPEVMELVNSLLHDPVKVAVDPISSPVEVIDQSVYFVDKGNKTKLLAHLIREKEIPSALVFTRTKHGANRVAQDLNKSGLTAAAIHGNKSQSARQQALADFKSGRVRVLVATDIAARGIDIEELPFVFNYNLPEVPETYVHRIGRTGRAGHEGSAISFCDFGEQTCLKSIEALTGRPLTVRESPWPMEVLEVPAKEQRGRPGRSQNARKQEKKAEPSGETGKKEAAAPKEKTGRRKKFTAPTKTLAEFEAEERAFQERLSRETTEHRAIRPSNALAGEKIMDATARLLAPKKSVKPDLHKEEKRKNPPRKQEQKKAESGKHRKAAPEKGSQRRRRDRGPRPVELRPRMLKDSTEQPSLMKPFYLGGDD